MKAPRKGHRLANKNSSSWCEKSPFELLIRRVQKNSQVIEAFAVVIACLPEVKGKSLLLKAPCPSDTELIRPESLLPEGDLS